MEEVLVPIVFFSCVFGMYYVYLTTRHKERVLMIENGYDVNKLNSKQQVQRYLLTLGFLAIGVGLGLIIGHTISNVFYDAFHIYKFNGETKYLSDYSEMAIAPSILFCCGLSLILSYKFDKKHVHSENQKSLNLSESSN